MRLACGWPALFVLLTSSAMTGCVSARIPDSDQPDRVRLTPDNFARIDGVYEASVYQGPPCQGCLGSTVSLADIATSYGLRRVYDDPSGGPPARDSAATVSLRVVGPDALVLTTSPGTSAAESRTIPGRLSEDGYFELRRSWKMLGYPPLLWGVADSGIRLGLSNDGGLILESAYEVGGFILLLGLTTHDESLSVQFDRRYVKR